MDLLKPSYATGYAKNASQSAHPNLWDGLVGAWMPSLGVTGETLRDVSGNGNHGTLTGMDAATDWVATSKGLALDFDGVNDYVACGAKNKFEFFLGDSISTSCWVKPTNTSSQTFQAMFTIGGSAGVLRDRTYQLRILSDRRVNALYRNLANSAWHEKRTNASHVNNNEWVNIATTFTYGAGASWKIYINGKEVASFYYSGNGNAAPINTSNDEVFIGVGEDGSSQHWLGNIGNFLLYRRYLSPQEIKQLYVDSLAPFRTKKRTVVRVPAAIPASTKVGSIKKPTTIIKPSYQAGYARNASESENPKLWDGLEMAYVPMGSTRLKDLSGNNRDPISTTGNLSTGIIKGVSSYNRTYPDTYMGYGVNSLVYDGSSGVDLGNTGFFRSAGEPMSYFFHSGSKPTTSSGALTTCWGGTSAGNIWYVSLTSFTAMNINYDPTGSGSVLNVGGVAFNMPHTGGFVYNGSNLRAYIDGLPAGQSGHIPNAAINKDQTSIGYNAFNNDTFHYGGIGSIYIWSRALTASEYKKLHRDPLAPFRKKQRVSVAVPAAVPTPSATYHPLRSLAHPLEQ